MEEYQSDSYSLYRKIPIFFKDKFIEPIDLRKVIQEIETRLPEIFFYGIDSLIVGDFDEFAERRVNAKFDNGSIYVTNNQSNEEDMVDDIVHEVGHNVEQNYSTDIYGDSEVEIEFLGKRKKLFHLLKQEYGSKLNGWGKSFMDTEYSPEFDDFLYQVIGYPLLTSLTMGLFISPYAITSLREYFATAFEEYFLKDRDYIRSISPRLYHKIEEVNF